ncbi:hypothetical protein Ade02nite_19710 [Paractinoplanes deccanensis]|uniref:Uncharacterized protein n=1 Tax=Paractinoplanes deccanensis TaxID=113561 RepID=A0ABQ3Y019_9ACTN|nr:hypothetical protein [Actinoplanes deccanensis]GID73330.1 hypothetical protein Ade02nite_19710 [Actinoplanes deccanensis]
MAIRISTAARNAMATAAAALVDGGSSTGRLRLYTGSQPAGPGTAPTGTLLAEITLNDPAFGGPANGTVTANQSPALTGTGVAAGTAGWFRIVDSTEAAGTGLGILDGSVSATGDDGECQLATTTISVGLTVTITSLTFTQPSS